MFIFIGNEGARESRLESAVALFRLFRFLFRLAVRVWSVLHFSLNPGTMFGRLSFYSLILYLFMNKHHDLSIYIK